METHKIYTVGSMGGLPLEYQISWRKELENAIKEKTDKNVVFYHPPLFYSYESQNHQSETEIKEWELNHVLDCDIVVVNLQYIGRSIGSHYELGAVDAMNMFGNKHIYVIGIGDKTDLHPWIELSLFRCEKDIEAAAEYIVSYLLP